VLRALESLPLESQGLSRSEIALKLGVTERPARRVISDVEEDGK
jgi:DNA-binding transcriptional regulator LsrR (DeoR family)